jgi:hypothetical protein
MAAEKRLGTLNAAKQTLQQTNCFVHPQKALIEEFQQAFTE